MGAKETLGDVIRKAREERGISQRELASKVNVSYSTISRIELGDTIVPVNSTLRAIAEALSIDYNYLLALNGQVPDEPEVRMIQRASRSMTKAQKEKMINILNACFDDAFKDAGSDMDWPYEDFTKKSES